MTQLIRRLVRVPWAHGSLACRERRARSITVQWFSRPPVFSFSHIPFRFLDYVHFKNITNLVWKIRKVFSSLLERDTVLINTSFYWYLFGYYYLVLFLNIFYLLFLCMSMYISMLLGSIVLSFSIMSNGNVIFWYFNKKVLSILYYSRSIIIL